MSKPEIRRASAGGRPELRATGLVRHFGGVAAVDNVSFTAAAGRILAVIGPNGAGKTTLFNLVSGFVRPHAGDLRFGEVSLNGLSPSRIAAHGIARTFQNLQTFRHMSVLENVQVGLHTLTSTGVLRAMFSTPAARREEHASREAAMAALERVGIAHIASQRAGTLSFGQQRLLEIARALAADPVALLLDEPASGLSGVAITRLAEIIRGIRSLGIAILLVEHNIGMVFDLADEILVMDHGKPIAYGPPAQVENDPRVISAYLGTEVPA